MFFTAKKIPPLSKHWLKDLIPTGAKILSVSARIIFAAPQPISGVECSPVRAEKVWQVPSAAIEPRADFTPVLPILWLQHQLDWSQVMEEVEHGVEVCLKKAQDPALLPIKIEGAFANRLANVPERNRIELDWMDILPQWLAHLNRYPHRLKAMQASTNELRLLFWSLQPRPIPPWVIDAAAEAPSVGRNITEGTLPLPECFEEAHVKTYLRKLKPLAWVMGQWVSKQFAELPADIQHRSKRLDVWGEDYPFPTPSALSSQDSAEVFQKGFTALHNRIRRFASLPLRESQMDIEASENSIRESQSLLEEIRTLLAEQRAKKEQFGSISAIRRKQHEENQKRMSFLKSELRSETPHSDNAAQQAIEALQKQLEQTYEAEEAEQKRCEEKHNRLEEAACRRLETITIGVENCKQQTVVKKQRLEYVLAAKGVREAYAATVVAEMFRVSHPAVYPAFVSNAEALLVDYARLGDQIATCDRTLHFLL